MWNVIKNLISPPTEWDKAQEWASGVHPGWLYLATQKKRPQLNEEYKQKILDEYRWIFNSTN
jgi:hypothetical protein